MKNRTLWGFVVFAAAVLAAVYWWKNKTPPTAPAAAPTLATTPAPATSTTTAAVPASATATPPTAATSPATTAAVKKQRTDATIQEGKTIDFSSGVPVVKDDAKQKAMIDKSVKDMDSAAAGVTFAPRAQKPAEPAPKP